MSDFLWFTVVGLPVTEGSLRAISSRKHPGKTTLIHDKDKELKEWRNRVHVAAFLAWRDAGWPFDLDEHVAISVVFVLPRPKSKRVGAPAKTKPDLDKLERSIGDALSPTAKERSKTGKARLLAEDSRIVTWRAHKRYAMPGEHSGAIVKVERSPAPVEGFPG